MAIFVLLISAFLSVTTLITDLSIKYFIAIGAILLAVTVYSYFVYKRHHLKCMGKSHSYYNSHNCCTVLLFTDGLTVLTQKLFTALYVNEEENAARLHEVDK